MNSLPRISVTTLRTAVGLTPATAAAAVRAGISRIEADSMIVDRGGAPLHCARVPWLDPGLAGQQRMVALCDAVVEDLLRQAPWLAAARIPVLLALPGHRPGWSTADEQSIVGHVSNLRGGAFAGNVYVAGRGHAGGLVALDVAANRISGGVSEACLVLAADSYLDPATITWLSTGARLCETDSRSGFAPGEGAAAILVSSRSFARGLGRELALVHRAGIAREPHTIDQGREVMGEGMAAALTIAMQHRQSDAAITDVYLDANGERYRSQEWGMAAVRRPGALFDPLTYVSAAQSWGDIGAASGLAFACLATESWRWGRSQGDLSLLVAGSDEGTRAAVVLERPGQSVAREAHPVSGEEQPSLPPGHANSNLAATAEPRGPLRVQTPSSCESPTVEATERLDLVVSGPPLVPGSDTPERDAEPDPTVIMPFHGETH